MCARLRMFPLLLNHPLFLTVRLTVRPPHIRLFLPQHFLKSLERMCVHANLNLKGPYAPMCVCVCVPGWRH